MSQNTERVAYSVKEVAAALGVSGWTVREEIRCGRIQSVKMGTRILVPRAVLDRIAGIDNDDDLSANTIECHERP